jgi:hypothetical protein
MAPASKGKRRQVAALHGALVICPSFARILTRTSSCTRSSAFVSCDSDGHRAAARGPVSPRRHRGHGDFTEASGFSVHLRVLRVSVVNTCSNSSLAWLPTTRRVLTYWVMVWPCCSRNPMITSATCGTWDSSSNISVAREAGCLQACLSRSRREKGGREQ